MQACRWDCQPEWTVCTYNHIARPNTMSWIWSQPSDCPNYSSTDHWSSTKTAPAHTKRSTCCSYYVTINVRWEPVCQTLVHFVITASICSWTYATTLVPCPCICQSTKHIQRYRHTVDVWECACVGVCLCVMFVCSLSVPSPRDLGRETRPPPLPVADLSLPLLMLY